MLVHQLKRFRYAFLGIFYAIRHDFSYRWQLLGGMTFLAAFGYLMWPLTQLEILALGISYGLVLITELQNSSFEAALDRLHPELHDEIGRSKDMAAGSVLTAGLLLLFVVVVIWLY